MSPIFPPEHDNTPKRLRLQYTAYGEHVGQLAVLDDQQDVLWKFSPTYEQAVSLRDWMSICVNLKLGQKFFIIEAVKGGAKAEDFKGDLSVDDLDLAIGVCASDVVAGECKNLSLRNQH